MRAAGSLALVLCLVFCGCSKKKEDCAKLEVQLGRLTAVAEGKLKTAEMREFLWRHWRNQECATLLLKRISLEGKETDTEYEIKRLPAATLVMVVTTNQARYGYQGQVLWHELAKDDVYTIERVQPNNPYLLNTDSRVDVLPSDANLSGSEYCLRLKGWGSEVVSFF